jgi:hypothetical protein
MWGTKLPKKAGNRYLVTFDGVVRQADFIEYPKGNFYWAILPSGTESVGSGRVTAWQKEPKPYKG